EHRRLQRGRVAARELLEEDALDVGVDRVEVEAARALGEAPAGRDVGREDAVGRLLQAGVAVLRVAHEAGLAALEDREALQALHDVALVAVGEDVRGAGLLALADEGVVVALAVDLDALPLVLLCVPAAARDPVERAGEVVREAEEEVLRRTDAVARE